MTWFPAELEQALAVGLATLDEQSRLIEANAGFLKLISVEKPLPIGARVARFLSNPTLQHLPGCEPAKLMGQSTVACLPLASSSGRHGHCERTFGA